ncbi:RpiB/LacA/LacB family sugar-phosphate isomerase [Candidatus Kaiserbacteria bacterium]|nr:RpiB/LacA/LacB family sugar-phosphate isomerase [Candidatus Kaiserbacteria bacterium]NCT02029.1 RpiB/LacA/LacB family sugar-phosphate isomerase [Candidatus Parcubacteria bacterium]
MVIHLATDHAGFAYKEAVLVWLQAEGFTVEDHGAYEYNDLDDFPDFISLAAAAVSADPFSSRGIIFGGSGQGEAITANRFPRVRAAVYYGGIDVIPALSRQHNDANILSIGARFVDINLAKQMIWEWLHTEAFTEDKYLRRNEKIEAITTKLHT